MKRITTVELLNLLTEEAESPIECQLYLNGGVFTRHSFMRESKTKIWHQAHDADEVVTEQELLKLYPEAMGAIWVTE